MTENVELQIPLAFGPRAKWLPVWKRITCFKYNYVVKPIEAQIAILRGIWPKLNVGAWIIEWEKRGHKRLMPDKSEWERHLARLHSDEFEMNSTAKHDGAEANFAIVRWQALAPTYGEALTKEVFQAMKLSRKGKFVNSDEGLPFSPDCFRQREHTMSALDLISKQQEGDILIFPAQFGKKYLDISVLRVREILADNEFGLGSVEVGSMLLTHPERLSSKEDLKINAPGDEFNVDRARSNRAESKFVAESGSVTICTASALCPGFKHDAGFISAPIFYYDKKKGVKFATNWASEVLFRPSGSVTGFISSSE